MERTFRKLKVVSNGSGAETVIVDAETGEDLRLPVTAVRWECAAVGLATLDSEVSFPGRDVKATLAFEFVSAEVIGQVSERTREEWNALMRKALGIDEDELLWLVQRLADLPMMPHGTFGDRAINDLREAAILILSRRTP